MTRPRRPLPRAGRVALALAALAGVPAAGASSLRACDRPLQPTAADKDILLRFSAVVKSTLAASGHDVALIARSGLDLHRLDDTRYSHAGIALKDNTELPWAVRELYYACDEKKPRLYDEGLAGFLLGTDDPSSGWVSLVLLPPRPSAALERVALDRRQALRLLGATYSANAYPFSTRYQNCNQWVIETIASAWGDRGDLADDPRPSWAGDGAGSNETGADTDTSTGTGTGIDNFADTRRTSGRAGTPDDARVRAQNWLRDQRYAPTVFEVSAHPMTWLPAFVAWLHNDDHPPAELGRNRYGVSMPLSIETFVHRLQPEAERIEICHAGRHVVIHRGWTDLPDACVAGPGDHTVELARD